jgi:hypothetical protein
MDQESDGLSCHGLDEEGVCGDELHPVRIKPQTRAKKATKKRMVIQEKK